VETKKRTKQENRGTCPQRKEGLEKGNNKGIIMFDRDREMQLLETSTSLDLTTKKNGISGRFKIV
jgi:hypothetical protein